MLLILFLHVVYFIDFFVRNSCFKPDCLVLRVHIAVFSTAAGVSGLEWGHNRQKVKEKIYISVIVVKDTEKQHTNYSIQIKYYALIQQEISAWGGDLLTFFGVNFGAVNMSPLAMIEAGSIQVHHCNDNQNYHLEKKSYIIA